MSAPSEHLNVKVRFENSIIDQIKLFMSQYIKIVDNVPLDNKQLVLASLDEHGEVVGLVILKHQHFLNNIKN
jgi:hypothetical protein